MHETISPPMPTRAKTRNFIRRTIAFPNGHVATVELSEWHWEMVAFTSLWDDYYGREAGILYEYLIRGPIVPDDEFSEIVMCFLREAYREWLAEVGEHQPILFEDPRA